MADALLQYFWQGLPSEIAEITKPHFARLKAADYQALLDSPEAHSLFYNNENGKQTSWADDVFQQLSNLLAGENKTKVGIYFCIGYAALLSFLQANVTGPILAFDPAKLLLAQDQRQDADRIQKIQQELLQGFNIDGISPYKLTPHIELLCLTEIVMTCPTVIKSIKAARWAKVRVNFLQQRLLSELSSNLQTIIYDDLGLVEDQLFSCGSSNDVDQLIKTEFLLERATIGLHYGQEAYARRDLERAKTSRQFEFALTGLLGKRTKFQQKDTSQLVVLANRRPTENGSYEKGPDDSDISGKWNETPLAEAPQIAPKNLDLDDDTLLESIAFVPRSADQMFVAEDSPLSPHLATLDPSNQPQLEPIDSIILLLIASSITNTSPADGLTREETLPFATRVLEGKSPNWQVYTQALLIRSRIEGYKSRTIERGLLQLQALVDQVVADTTAIDSASPNGPAATAPGTFLPKAEQSEAASATERLRYIFQLASPTRWELEAELAARWTQLGGLRSALDIYERLQMWPEVALCWAATGREDKARKLVRKQLYHATSSGAQKSDADATEDESWGGPAREPPPSDAPRLYCILGDIDSSPEMYELAWEVSKQRYARAQRSLGRLCFSSKDYARAAQAYGKSLKADQLNHSSWFALGCALLELEQFGKAVEAFSRCVQLDESDAESWSNLAAALLRKGPDEVGTNGKPGLSLEDDDEDVLDPSSSSVTKQQNNQDALKALKRAAALKHDSYRIWENVLIVSAAVIPPDYTSILTAQKHIIDLRGSTDGEKCIDYEILDMLTRHVISMSSSYDPTTPGLQRMVVKFVDESIVPLITGSADLWRLVSRLALWRGKPTTALDAEEKAWRAVVMRPGWETESEALWKEVVEATTQLSDSYESLGPRERTEGITAGTPVAKDWRFKARTAIRGIMGRGKASWEDTAGWDVLKNRLEELRN